MKTGLRQQDRSRNFMYVCVIVAVYILKHTQIKN